jgi:hypothetical protein
MKRLGICLRDRAGRFIDANQTLQDIVPEKVVGQ